jgi:hypothetical protein
MSDIHEHSGQDSKLSTLMLATVIILGLLYFLAKGCTNNSEHETAPASHHAVINISANHAVLQS